MYTAGIFTDDIRENSKLIIEEPPGQVADRFPSMARATPDQACNSLENICSLIHFANMRLTFMTFRCVKSFLARTNYRAAMIATNAPRTAAAEAMALTAAPVNGAVLPLALTAPVPDADGEEATGAAAAVVLAVVLG